MSGNSNFLVFNPTDTTNTEDDATYAAEPQRTNGLENGIAKTSMHNKFYRQVSVMAAALAQFMANQGQTVSDSDLNALTTVISNSFMQRVSTVLDTGIDADTYVWQNGVYSGTTNVVNMPVSGHAWIVAANVIDTDNVALIAFDLSVPGYFYLRQKARGTWSSWINSVAPLSSSTPSGETVGASGSAGTSTSAARADHIHPMPAAYTPSAHASSHASGGSDQVTPAAIGAATQNDFSAHLADIATSSHLAHVKASASVTVAGDGTLGIAAAAPSGGLGTTNSAGSSTSFARADHTHLAFDSTNPVMDGTAAPGTATVAARRDHIHPTDTSRLAASAYTAADVLAKLKTVDGSGSGLDADTLDGQQGSYYAPINDPLFGGNITIAGGWITLNNTQDKGLKLVDGVGGSKSLRSESNQFQVINNAYNTVLYTLDDSGNSTATGNVTAYSDIRLKTDIEKINNALAKVSQLNGYTFKRTDLGIRQTGLIAQEVQNVLPEAVIEGEYLSLAYGNMVGLLVEAIKEQQTQINELKTMIGKLGG